MDLKGRDFLKLLDYKTEEIEYLMARGLDEDEATATIVRGFLNVNIEGLPDSLAKKITETLDTFSYNKGM